jgi:hypothetical protein
MIDRSNLKTGVWRSWPCGNCGGSLNIGPAWDADAGGWRCQSCGRFERDVEEPSMFDAVKAMAGLMIVILVLLILLQSLGLVRL